MVKCTGCGAGMKFDPATQKLICDYCDTKIYPKDAKVYKPANGEVDITAQDIEDNRIEQAETEGDIVNITQDNQNDNENFYEAMVFTCPDCGANITSDFDTAVTFCSYCGNSVSLEGRLTRLKRPNRIIPFKKTFSEAIKKYSRHIKSSLFAPRWLTMDTTIDNFRGMYMPYWTYDYKLKSEIKIPARQSRRHGNYTYVDNYVFNSSYECDYEGLSYDASTGFSDRLSNAIAPFNIDEAEHFSEAYMAGFYADAGDVDQEAYYGSAMKLINSDINRCALDRKELKIMTVDNKNVKHTAIEEEASETLSYFPVWFLANRYSNDKVSYAIVNGQTGEVAADIPISYPKFIIGTILMALPIIFLLNFVVTMRPMMLLIVTIIFSIFSILLASSQADALYVRSNFFDDIGMQIKKFGNVQNLDIFKKTKVKDKTTKDIISVVMTIVYMAGFVALLGFGKYGDIIIVLMFIASVTRGAVLDGLNAKFEKKTIKTERIVIHQPLEDKLKYIIKPIISIVIAGMVLILDPTMDYWYYGGTIVAMLLTLLSFYDLVALHNKLSMRTPPQLKKEGGDM